MKYLLIVIITILTGEDSPKRFTLHLPQESYEDCLTTSEDFNIDVSLFPFIKFEVESDCRVRESETIKT